MAKVRNLGSSVLELSRFDDDFEAAQQAARDEYETRRKANEQKRREQKRIFDAEAQSFRRARESVLEEPVYRLLSLMGLRISHELSEVLSDKSRLELLDGAGGYEVLFGRDKEVVEALCLFLSERIDISKEISSFVNKKYEDLG